MENENEMKTLSEAAARGIFAEVVNLFLEQVEKGDRQEITKKCGMDDGTVSRWIKGERQERPRLERLLRLVYGLELSAVEIISLINKYRKLPDTPPEKITPNPKKIKSL